MIFEDQVGIVTWDGGSLSFSGCTLDSDEVDHNFTLALDSSKNVDAYEYITGLVTVLFWSRRDPSDRHLVQVGDAMGIHTCGKGFSIVCIDPTHNHYK